MTIDVDKAIDLHVHSAPDVYPRLLDDLEVVRAAETSGMRAILLKSHHTLTADRALMVQKQVSIQVRGGLALNLTVGGLNPVAVETALAFGARQIWMPTIHARHCLRTATGEMFEAEARKGHPGIVPFDEEGEPVPELLVILEMIRDAGAILGTGHLAPSESLKLIALAREMQLERILVTHPIMSFTRFTTEQMQHAADLGAILEFDALSCRENWPQSMPPSTTAQAIQAVGSSRCVLASDGGQVINPSAPEMLFAFAHDLTQHGVCTESLKVMMHDNPAWLLDV
jgi:hypothetical protein